MNNSTSRCNKHMMHEMKNEHASLLLSLAQAKEAITSFWTELYRKLFWHAREWYDQMLLKKTMQNHIKNNTIGATDQRESMKQDMKPYMSKSTPHIKWHKSGITRLPRHITTQHEWIGSRKNTTTTTKHSQSSIWQNYIICHNLHLSTLWATCNIATALQIWQIIYVAVASQ